MRYWKSTLCLICVVVLLASSCNAGDDRKTNLAHERKKVSENLEYELGYESGKVINGPVHMFAAADLDGNGRREIVMINFGYIGGHFIERQMWNEEPDKYDMVVVEWDGEGFRERWKKQWDLTGVYDSLEHEPFSSVLSHN